MNRLILAITGLKRPSLPLMRKLRRRVCRRIFFDLGNGASNAVLLVGTGRSGTTWVSDVINHKNDYRYLFEPFYPNKVALCSHFRYRQYLRPGDGRREFLEPARRILSGRLRNDWVDGHNRVMLARKRLIKDIRAHHLMGWLHDHFPGLRMILLLRHPCAVAHSKLKLKWGAPLEEFLGQDELMQDFLSPFRSEIRSAQTVFEKQVFLWCVENYVPLKQFRTGELHVAFYENFCTDPQEEVRSLFAYLQEEPDQRVFEALKRPSVEARKDSAVISGKDPASEWKAHVSEGQKRTARDILALFELDGLYDSEGRPNVEAVCAKLSPR